MTYSIVFHPIALDEYKEASIWYETRQEGLGIRFEEAIEDKIRQILNDPLTYKKVKGSYRQTITRCFHL